MIAKDRTMKVVRIHSDKPTVSRMMKAKDRFPASLDGVISWICDKRSWLQKRCDEGDYCPYCRHYGDDCDGIEDMEQLERDEYYINVIRPQIGDLSSRRSW